MTSIQRLQNLNARVTEFAQNDIFDEGGYVYRIPKGPLPEGLGGISLEPIGKTKGLGGHLKRHWGKYAMGGLAGVTGAAMHSISSRPNRYNERQYAFARGDFVNQSRHFPTTGLEDRLNMTAASFRPASTGDGLRQWMNRNTVGKIALGPRDQLARGVRRSRSVTQNVSKIFKNFPE